MNYFGKLRLIRTRLAYFVLAFIALALVLPTGGCDKDVHVYVGAKFRISNDTDEDLHIYLNTVYQCSVESGEVVKISDLDEGDYEAEARRQSDDAVVKKESFYFEEGESYWWVLK